MNSISMALLLLLGLGAPAGAAQNLIIWVGPAANIEQLPGLLKLLGARDVEPLPAFGMIALETPTIKLPKALWRMGSLFPGFKFTQDVEMSIEAEDAGADGGPAGSSDEVIPEGVRAVEAPAVWGVVTGRGVKVAVVDTGIDFTHPDLAPNYAGGVNILHPSAEPLDDQGHGTHVAGTIAAARDGRGVVGVAPEASLYAVKVLDGQGRGGLIGLIKGLHWCATHHMDVANLSMSFGKNGLGPASFILNIAVDLTTRSGVTIVAAAGNSHGRVEEPASYGRVIAVSAADADGTLAWFSDFGPQVDFIAPGTGVLSTFPGGGYQTMQGTSMATPHVSGLAALAIQLGARGPDAVRAKLASAADQLAGLSRDEQGLGFIHAGRWVNEVALAN